MARKPQKRQSIGLFDVPGHRADNDEIPVPAGPAGLLGGPDPADGPFDDAQRGPGGMPGLFDKPRRPAADRAGLADKPSWAPGRGLFDKPAPRRK